MKTQQRGVSLIGIMVGLMLGLIAVLAATSVYKTLVFKSIDIKSRSKIDFSVNASMVSVDIELSKAGFGVEASTNSCLGPSLAGPAAAANTDLILLNNSALTSSTSSASRISGTSTTIGNVGGTAVTGNGLVWHWLESGAHRCAGLVAEDGGLRRLGPMDCTNAQEWDELTWPIHTLIESGTLPGASGSITDKAVQFTARRVASCIPYQIAAGGSAVELVMRAGSGAADLSTQQAICLPNICQ